MTEIIPYHLIRADWNFLYHLLRVLFDLNNAEYFGHGEHMISLFDYVSMFLTGRKTLKTSENDIIHGLVCWKKNLVYDENGKSKQQLLSVPEVS